MVLSFFIIIAYLSGSIPFAKIISGRQGVDIQKRGSGNIGFSNTLRVLGWSSARKVLLGDILKGFFPVIIAMNYLNGNSIILVGISAVLGHIFPIWLGFRGGKGIAVGSGVYLAISPVIGLLGIATYLLCYIIIKISAPASLIAAWFVPVYALVFEPGYLAFFISLAAVVTWTHRKNIRQRFREFS